MNSMPSKCKTKTKTQNIESRECTKMLIEYPNERGKIIGLRMILFFCKHHSFPNFIQENAFLL